tara:strand:- start:317 stop:1009 length:693 start_codon:yes stop_codon:yes gene_type:complete
MAIITTGNNFGATAAVTSTTLNNIANAATFDDPVDGTSLELKGDGKLGIKDAGVTVAKIGGITDSLKVIGRTTAGAGVAEEVTINDDNDLSSASAITLATDESIKAYVDAQDLTEYALKYSGSTGTKSVTSSFADWDISSVVGVNRAMVIIEMWDASTGVSLMLRTKGSSVEPYTTTSSAGWGAAGVITSTANQGGTLVVITDASGVIQLKGKVSATSINYKIQAYQKLA